METPEEVIKHECGKCGKCEIHNPDEENSYHGNWCCNIEYCEDCDCDCDEWAACYGAKTVKSREYIMAGGGSHWWNYVVEFDQHGEQVFVYIENKDGKHQQFRQKLAYRIKDGVEQMRLVGKDWEPDVLQEEGLVFYCE